MLYVRGVPADYDGWAASGAKGWAWKDVLPYFKKSESNIRGSDELHGDAGPLQVSEPRAPMAINEAFIAAAGERQIRHNPRFQRQPIRKASVSIRLPNFTNRAVRANVVQLPQPILHPVMDRKNLEVITGARATKILMDGKRATGIVYSTGQERKRRYQQHERSFCAAVHSTLRNCCNCPALVTRTI